MTLNLTPTRDLPPAMPESLLHISSELFVYRCTAPTPDAVHDCPRAPYNCLGRLRGERTTPASSHLSWRFEPSGPEFCPLPWGSYTAALRDAYDYAATPEPLDTSSPTP